MEKLIAKAGARGRIFVVKYGGSFMDSPDPAVREGVARDVVALQAAGILPVVVHGGGKAITRAMEEAGVKANFVQGMRVTDEKTSAVVERVLSNEINPEIVATMKKLGGKAQGFSGTEIFRCEKLWLRDSAGEKVDVGYVGDVTGVDATQLRDTLAGGLIPVISPTARGGDGKIYNCNADVAAAQAAIALGAHRLVFLSDVPGLLRDPQDPKTLISHLAESEVIELKRAGIIDRGMIPKVDSAVAARRAGVKEVLFLDGRVSHALLRDIFADEETGGTKIVS
ncbi:MAG TPA: acetylglutamate kinase [Verrucomicrobiae bacterium]|jgi:acetylglutamate kinase|nr:acetylglutamate kinase [Verrucomicrobiae bacterium]